MTRNVAGYFLLFFLVVAIFVSGCAFNRTQHRSSSVVEFLYPNTSMREVRPGIPRLQLPLKVGIAFVPGRVQSHRVLTESHKTVLMKQVSERFRRYDFVGSIELIPSAYLRPRGSFANLDQIQRMYDVDVVALLAYDQTQFTDEGLASIAYWTIVGAYVIPGEKNDTHTMIDATVYDIASRKLLFRAPGVHHIDSLATPVNLSEQLRNDSLKGFQKASENLTENLEFELASFRQKVKQAPADYQVVRRSGYAGGATNPYGLLLLAGLGVWLHRSRRSGAGG
ncbi:rhombotarget lipoprotein [Exilibacterium tricleocarpae]|uniref:Rhombotarget lipoprotein n=1 Tax=Exilibacterium tricleocarpae TaxID=2591008 RepID=A0A545TFJ3_9GAMM|nr:rhombotarget lipoprotein [Exilibacterium tricleocarpae]TQV75993.1 rhombotarget lipoprotein [Exilibacterium tricleocarpae]